MFSSCFGVSKPFRFSPLSLYLGVGPKLLYIVYSMWFDICVSQSSNDQFGIIFCFWSFRPIVFHQVVHTHSRMVVSHLFSNNQLACIQSVFSINSGLCCLRFHMMSGKLDNHPHLNPSWFIIVFPCTSGGKTEACRCVVLVRIACMRPMTTLLTP